MAPRKVGDRPGMRGGSTGSNPDNEAVAAELAEALDAHDLAAATDRAQQRIRRELEQRQQGGQ